MTLTSAHTLATNSDRGPDPACVPTSNPDPTPNPNLNPTRAC